MDRLTTNMGTIPVTTRRNGKVTGQATLAPATALAALKKTLPTPQLTDADLAAAGVDYPGRWERWEKTVNGPHYWHECLCPDDFKSRGFTVFYCPTHGHPRYALDELGQVESCGRRCCTQVQEDYAWEQHQGITHLRDNKFVEQPYGKENR